MNTYIRSVPLLMIGALLSTITLNAQTIQVTPAIAPNAFGSPSYSAWESNAVMALEQGLTTNGGPGPSQYNALTSGTIPLSQLVVTNFPSWLGSADPGSVYGPAYANELGDRVQFGLVITSTTPFSISQLSLVGTSSDPGDLLGFSIPSGSFNYSSGYVGIQAGGAIITSGPNTQLVNEIVARGTGNAFESLEGDPGATDQEKIDNDVAALASQGYNVPVTFTGTYTLGSASGSSSVIIEPVPEPTSLALIGSAALAVTLGRRRRAGRAL